MKKPFKLPILLLSFGLVAGTISQSHGLKKNENSDGIDDVIDTFVPEYENIKLNKFVTPEDDKYSTQKNYSMNIVGDIEDVWDSYTGAGTKIAIIDDGFDPTHEEYIRKDGSSAILSNSAYFKSSGSYYVTVTKTLYSADSTCLNQEWDTANSKWATHGTNTSTTAAAPMGNGGIVGIAPNADLLLIKTDMLLTSIDKAIRYAADQGCDVINMSLGAYAESFTDGYGNVYTTGTPAAGETQVYESTATALESACVYAHEKGSIIVAAAGNEATSVHSYPACNSYVIGVGALGQNLAGKVAKFSNHNKSESETGNKNVDILAPGYIYAAGKGGTKTSPTHIYNNNQGTSFSSPIVAGAACLWKQKNPDGTPDQFEQKLYDTAAGIGTYKDVTISPASGKNIDVNISGGRLDIAALMNLGSDVSGITLSETTKNLYTSGSYSSNTSFEISATVIPSSALNQNITWSTTNSNVAKLSKTSTVSGEIISVSAGTTAGTATIKAKSQDGGFEASCTVNTTKYVPVTGFSIKDENGNTSGTIKKGETIQLIPTITPSNASNKEVIYLPDDESIVSVDDNTGIVTGLKTGSTDIYALCGNEELDDVYSITVEEADGGGKIYIDCYDGSTISNSSSTNCWSLESFNNRVTLNNVINNSVISKVEQDKAYKRKGGIALGSSSSKGDITLTFDSTYKIDKVTLIGTYWDSNNSSTITLAGKSGTGSLNKTGTEPTKCENSIVFDNLGGISSFKVYSPNRAVVYSLECECSGGGGDVPVTQNYTVSFNSNGGTGSMSDSTTNGSSFVTPSCDFTKNDCTFDKWALDSISGTKYAVRETITNISNNITLYATWTENQSGGDDDEDISYWTNWISNNQSALSTGGTTLVSALRTKISNVAPGSSNKLSYDDLWNAYAKTDGIPGSNGTKIYDMYGGFEFRKGTDQAGSYSKEGDVYNREHSVPKSWFSEHNPAYSDIIHVVPTDGKVNGMRSNNTFGEVNDASYSYSFPARSYNGVQYQKAGVSKLGSPKAINGVTTTQSVVFEPDDQYKGDFARIYMYFAVRYGNTTCSAITGSGSAIFTNTFTNSNPYVTNYGLALLKKWHELDPVSEKEIARNNAVEEVQGNRNPFVDYPEWADKIFGTNTTGGDTPTPKVNSISLDKTTLTLDLNGTKTASLVATVDADEGVDKTVSWTSSVPSVATVSNGTVTAVAKGTTIITAKAGEKQATCSVTVNDSSVTVTSVTLDKATLTLNVGEDSTLKATIKGTNIPSGAKATWSSDKSNIASVDTNGKVTGVASGSAVITATYGGKSATCTVNVKESGTPGPGPTPTGDYTLLTDIGNLSDGDQIVIASNTKGFTMTDFVKDKTFMGNVASTFSSNYSTITKLGEGTLELTAKKDGDNWKFITSDKTLNCKSKGSLSYTEGTSTWTIAIDKNSKATITSTTTSYGYFMYNVSSPRFTTYTSNPSDTMLLPQIYYKSSGGTPDPDKEITSIELECATTTVIFGEGKGTYEADAKLKATYNNSTSGYLTPESKDYSINTYVLGDHTIFATYDGKTYERTIKVTNNGSKYEESSMSDSITKTLALSTSNKFTTSSKTVSGWTVDLGGTSNVEASGSGTSGYNKFGSSKSSFTKLLFSFGSGDNVYSSVSIKLCRSNTSCSGNLVAYTLDSDGNRVDLVLNTVKNNSGSSLSITTAIPTGTATSSMYTYTFTAADGTTPKGTIYIGIDGSSGGKQLYVNNLSCTYKEVTQPDNNFSLDQQAEAWSNYFIKLTGGGEFDGPCKKGTYSEKKTELQKVWGELKSEYLYMVEGSKTAFCSSDASETIAEAVQHYRYIVATYGLEDFAEVPQISSSNRLIPAVDSQSFVLVIVAMVGSLAICGLLVYKKRKED